jgi:hypothetical protein
MTRVAAKSVRFVENLSPKSIQKPAPLLDTDLRITRRGRLRLRLIVTRNKADFDEVTRRTTGCVHRRAWGIVNPLRCDVLSFRGGVEKRRVEYDRRYFAVMILNGAKLHNGGTEHVAHECGHAAIFYARRAKSMKWHGRVEKDDEANEAICYPLGAIFRAVNIALHDAGVWG